MSQKIGFYNEIIYSVMQLLAGISFFFSAQIITTGCMSPLYVQILFVLCYVAVIVIRHYINGNLLIYMLAHLTLFSTLMVIDLADVMFIIFAVYLILMTVGSIIYWHKNGMMDNVNVSWISFVLLCVSYIYAFLNGYNLLKNYILIAGCIYMLLYMIRLYLKGLYDLSKNQLLHKQLPLAQITKSNSYIIGMLIVIMALSMLIAVAINLDGLLYIIGDFLMTVLRVLIKGIINLFTIVAKLLKNHDIAETGSLWDGIGKEIGEEGLISKIFNFIMALLKILFSLYVIYRLGKGMSSGIAKLLSGNNLPFDKVECIKVKENGIKQTVKNIIQNNPDKPKSKIRRKYKRAVLKLRDKIVLKESMTVGQIEAQMAEEDAAKMSSLKEAYERERYRDET